MCYFEKLKVKKPNNEMKSHNTYIKNIKKVKVPSSKKPSKIKPRF